MVEPHRLRHWRLPALPGDVVFHTCARPGRSKNSYGKVPDNILRKWVSKLPAESDVAVVSLLGEKRDGTSEYSFYSFHAKGRSFQQWLDKNCPTKGVQVVEHPTIDFDRVPTETMEAVASDISRLLSEGRTVVLMDSGGEERIRQVCRHMDAIEDSRRVTY